LKLSLQIYQLLKVCKEICTLSVQKASVGCWRTGIVLLGLYSRNPDSAELLFRIDGTLRLSLSSFVSFRFPLLINLLFPFDSLSLLVSFFVFLFLSLPLTLLISLFLAFILFSFLAFFILSFPSSFLSFLLTILYFLPFSFFYVFP